MNKLSLKLDDLTVESFTPSGEVAGRGTVEGRGDTMGYYTCLENTCDGGTCGRQFSEATCDNTCGQPATCGYEWCGTYPNMGCPNSQWYCTDCRWIC
ncbi:MAG TPA: hypothetical protein VF665_02550 [Longimicrobium sp.]|jgi:hypothetical protein|uniref:hypothetical protein n=1 Tax=Longimicrobium sp. TaxID=2029185 RepID=UPI002ED7E75D